MLGRFSAAAREVSRGDAETRGRQKARSVARGNRRNIVRLRVWFCGVLDGDALNSSALFFGREIVSRFVSDVCDFLEGWCALKFSAARKSLVVFGNES